MKKNRRAFLFFGLAVLCATAAAYTAKNMVQNGSAVAAVPVIETTKVVIARADLSAGAAIRSEQLVVAEWPDDYLPDDIFQSAGELDGRVPRRAISAGEPLIAGLLHPEGADAGLVSVINENVRAVSVKVDPVIGVAGFVRPGTRVDVLATLRRIDLTKPLPYSKIILQDIKVLAIDQQMETASDRDPEIVSVVTLEVTPKQAEQLIYSAHEGKLQLALRGPGDHEILKTKAVGVSDLLGTRKRKGVAVRRQRVEIVSGSSVNTKRF
jgi:pilus assembly protein CpaB